jgi:hypothetical protein
VLPTASVATMVIEAMPSWSVNASGDVHGVNCVAPVSLQAVVAFLVAENTTLPETGVVSPTRS